MLIEIEKIKVTDRIRKDFGNIQELADDIKKYGLINPPVITPDTYDLIAGLYLGNQYYEFSWSIALTIWIISFISGTVFLGFREVIYCFKIY